MSKLLVSRFLIPLVAVICAVLFVLRPGGVDGPAPPAVQQQGQGFDHQLWTDILSKIRRPDGTVDFEAVRQAKPQIQRYLGSLRASSPLSAPHRFRERTGRLAYYLNAYNATLVNLIAEHCPVASPADIYWADGVFWRVSVLIGEATVTLTDLETNRIEPLVLSDPRVAFAIYRGSESSPLLQEKAFDAGSLDQQLTRIAQQASSDERFVKIDGNTVSLNPIFYWNKMDIGDFQTWLSRYGVTVGNDVQFVQAPYNERLSEWKETCSGYVQ